MEGLPESCIARVLASTTPKDVCRLSVVNRTFKSAGNSDYVWEKMLPSQYHHLLARAPSPPQFSSKKELYFRLCHPLSIDNGAKKFWLERPTGKICFMLSARDLAITWGNDDRYWHWISQRDSSFEDLAELIAVCWLEVQGQFDCKLLSPCTPYTLSFRLKLQDSPHGHHRLWGRGFIYFMNRSYGWDHKPVKFSVTTPDGYHMESARFIYNTEKPVEDEGYQMTPLRRAEQGWMEFDAGEFVVDENGDSSKEVTFYMRELGGNWKGGLLLAAVKIQPSSLVRESHY
eukprot:Gb_16253 [translate_table: standard]